MSHEIVKKIRIEDNKVFITSESNNVSPKYYKERESTYCSEILQSEGMNGLNICLLKAYEEGNFKPGVENKWSRAITRLCHTAEYKKYSWRISDYSDNCPIQAARKSPEFNTLLLSSLTLQPPKEKYVVKKTVDGEDRFILKITPRFIKFTAEKSKAKIFQFKESAENLCNNYPNYRTEIL